MEQNDLIREQEIWPKRKNDDYHVYHAEFFFLLPNQFKPLIYGFLNTHNWRMRTESSGHKACEY